MPYTKTHKPLKREPTRATVYVGAYVEPDIAKAMEAQRRETGQTYSQIVREALRAYFVNKCGQ